MGLRRAASRRQADAGVLPFGFSPYEVLDDRPHVMVDGSPRRSSVLTLSHWPQSPTSPLFARDLSAEIAFEFARHATGSTSPSSRRERDAGAAAIEASRRAEAVTCDHFDEDGLMAVLVLTDPAFCFEHEHLVVEAARCGDFGIVTTEEAARVAFAIGPLAEQEAGEGAGTSERYAAVLERTRDLIERPGAYEALWHEEMQPYRAGRSAIERGDVVIAEEPGDLAVVSRTGTDGSAHRLVGATGGLPVHAAAVHSSTPCSRVLAFDGARCELYLRYEGWVKFMSRKVPLRPDLAPLAAELSAMEPGPVLWEANAVGAIVGRLRPTEGITELAPGVILDAVRTYLEKAPPAWDPFRPGGALLPPA